MKKTKPILMLMAIFVVIFATACGGSSAAPTEAAQVAVPTEAAAQAAQPTEAAAQAATEPAQAAVPIDVADTVASDTYCVQKIPYQNILLEPGTTFQSLDSTGDLKCSDSGTDVDGKDVITCTSKELWTYELQLSNSSGGSKTIKVNMGACPTQ